MEQHEQEPRQQKAGSMHDRGSREVVGGKLDAIWISHEAQKSGAQRQDGDEMRQRREDAVTMKREALKEQLLDAQDDMAARARAELEYQLADAFPSVAALRAQAPVDSERLRRQAA